MQPGLRIIYYSSDGRRNVEELWWVEAAGPSERAKLLRASWKFLIGFRWRAINSLLYAPTGPLTNAHKLCGKLGKWVGVGDADALLLLVLGW